MDNTTMSFQDAEALWLESLQTRSESIYQSGIHVHTQASCPSLVLDYCNAAGLCALYNCSYDADATNSLERMVY